METGCWLVYQASDSDALHRDSEFRIDDLSSVAHGSHSTAPFGTNRPPKEFLPRGKNSLHDVPHMSQLTLNANRIGGASIGSRIVIR